MIAIAGAKGGCGKTVTALGLADAFARAGTPSVAVDADQQLPSLHVIGSVDREPTLGALDAGRGINAVTQQSPREKNSGIVAAPLETDAVDITGTLKRLDRASVQVLVDCPPGAGEDVAEPLAAADGVVVVTMDRPSGIESAHTTVELARRLNVPVAGLILNRCTAPSREVRAAFDLPILTAVPERSSPLSDTGVCSAYDAASAKLRGESDAGKPGWQSTRQQEARRLPTGVPAVDSALGGGLFPGTITAFSGPADHSERLLSQLPTQRNALYVTTSRSEQEIEDALGPSDTGVTRIAELDDDGPIRQTTELIERLPDDTTFVVDTVDALETTDRAAYLDFLNQLVMHVSGSSRVAVLHCREDSGSANRATTKRFADTVLEL